MPVAKKLFKILVYTFACIGFVLVMTYLAVEFGLTKTKGIVDGQHDYFKNQLKNSSPTEAWNTGEEWTVLTYAIQQDKAVIDEAAKKADVSPRLIVSILVVEQLRLFHSNRELFKQVFSPLKILAVQSQFSWGVMGVKHDTARDIEKYLKDSTSEFYPGKKYENILDFTTQDPDTERFNRLTNEDDRSYSYLYAALYAKEIISQWEKAGFPIDKKPAIIATLYSLGFEKSKPHENPLSGGAEIEISGTSYSFGSLAQKFYDSDELMGVFPR